MRRLRRQTGPQPGHRAITPRVGSLRARGRSRLVLRLAIDPGDEDRDGIPEAGRRRPERADPVALRRLRSPRRLVVEIQLADLRHPSAIRLAVRGADLEDAVPGGI